MRNFLESCDVLDWDSQTWRSYFFAELSALAYHDGTRVKKEVKKIGFKKYKFLENDGAQCHIIENPTNFIIAFRGTEPSEFSDVKADLLAVKRKSRTEGQVHMGFLLEIRKLWPDIKALLPKTKKKQIWITGHSLGAAMATLCASRLEDRTPKLYTYGSPRVGGKLFVMGCMIDHYRFVNNNDVVTKVPFWIMGFRHHGDLTYINYYGNVRKLTYWQKVKDHMRGRRAAIKKLQFFDGMRDHSITDYADSLKKQLPVVQTDYTD
jgi:triacylglycerol lipase|tara:strand:- start:232 stop:1023 length:792 start_codon:yes stop_codon:yes gene_type:complete